MLSDLLTLRKEILTASAGHEQTEKAAAFHGQVVAEIYSLFDDPEFPKRRRSFGVIRKRLGVFDPDDPELKDILFSMGARVHKGEGEEAMWELALAKQTATNATPKTKKPHWARLSLWLIVVAVVLVVTNTFLSAVFEISLLDLLKSLMGTAQSHEACIKAANGNYLEIIQCNSKHG